MKAVVSTTYDSKYLFFLPIVSWLWNRLGVDVICFLPDKISGYTGEDMLNTSKRLVLVEDTVIKHCGSKNNLEVRFSCPEHKEATYAQCARLYAACLDLPEDEELITGDVDMGVFRVDFLHRTDHGCFNIYGIDLVPEGQMPMCYAHSKVSTWREYFTKGRTYQECLDAELANEECENFRGNMWSRDQELLFKGVSRSGIYVNGQRARPGTQFASNRIDRDDAYFMDRLSPDIIDYHMHRPGFTDDNFEKILSVLQYFYPNEDLTWMKTYQENYKQLI